MSSSEYKWGRVSLTASNDLKHLKIVQKGITVKSEVKWVRVSMSEVVKWSKKSQNCPKMV